MERGIPLMRDERGIPKGWKWHPRGMVVINRNSSLRSDTWIIYFSGAFGTSKIIGLAGEIQNKRDWSRTPTGLLALFIKRPEHFQTRGTNTLGPIQTRDRELARTRPFWGHLTVVKIDFIENRQWISRKVDKSTIWGLTDRFFQTDWPWINNLKWSVNPMMQHWLFLFKKPIIGFLFIWMT